MSKNLIHDNLEYEGVIKDSSRHNFFEEVELFVRPSGIDVYRFLRGMFAVYGGIAFMTAIATGSYLFTIPITVSSIMVFGLFTLLIYKSRIEYY